MSKRGANISIREFRKGIRSLERQVELALLTQTECCGVTPAQCHLLLALEESGETSIGELAAAMELDTSTLSRAVNALVHGGILDRREDRDNRRRQLVKLTPEGQALVDRINGSCDRYYEGLLATLPEEEALAVAKALPVFVQAMKEWRLNGGAACSCAGGETAL